MNLCVDPTDLHVSNFVLPMVQESAPLEGAPREHSCHHSCLNHHMHVQCEAWKSPVAVSKTWRGKAKVSKVGEGMLLI